MTHAQFNAEHERCLTFIKDAVAYSQAAHKIVVTHHVPSFRMLHPKFQGSKANVAFTVELEDYITDSGIDYWIYGHSHTNIDARIGKKIFTVNRLDNKEGRSFFREVFIRRGSTSGVYGVEEPHECYMTYTTERAEKEALKLYKHELKCRHQEAIERYCRDWDASGIGKSLAFAQKVNEAGHVLNLTDDGATRR